MADQIEGRLRAADPLAGGDGDIPSPARLDAISESVMHRELRGASSWRRAAGLAALATGGVAALVLAANLAAPALTVAFSPEPVAATAAQIDAAAKACDFADPADLSLELHGNAGIALYDSPTAFGSCLVVLDGDSVRYAGIKGVAVGGPRPTTEHGLFVTGGNAMVGGRRITEIVGVAPEGATKVEIEGVPGAYANVVGGHFGIWLDETVNVDEVTLVARDAAGTELQRDPMTSRIPLETGSSAP